MSCQIKSLKAKIILNSQEQETVEVQLETESGCFVASVPTGISTGKYEAKNLSAKKAVEKVKEIEKSLLNEDGPRSVFTDQKQVDDILIKLAGKQKAKIGANTCLAVSIVMARALAKSAKLPLYLWINQCYGVGHLNIGKKKKMPRPCFNVLEGGRHTKSDLSIQEFMVVPKGKTFKENLKAGREIYQYLGKVLEDVFGEEQEIGDEGGFAPYINQTEEVFSLLKQAVEEAQKAGLKTKIELGLDVAASEFYKSNSHYFFEGQKQSARELMVFYKTILSEHPIVFIEDPFDQNDFSAWAIFKRQALKYWKKGLIVGDDLLVTNTQRMKKAKVKDLCNAMILKPNQIGTITETLAAAKLAKEYGWKIIVSHRGGETEDDFIADLAVAIGADFIKAGAPEPKERMAKYNRLLKIEKELGSL